MKKPTKKSNEVQLLELLKQVLSKAAPDADLAGRIYQAVETALQARARAEAFEKFCEKLAVADLEPASLAGIQEQLNASFGEGDVSLEPDPEGNRLAVEVTLPDGSEFLSMIKVDPAAAAALEAGDPEVPLKFVPFPVCLPGDPEMVWMLARHETLTPEEGGLALNRAEGDFWASKTGQRLLRKRLAERTFPEFIARVPAGMLREVGLKRHYKDPEPVKPHHSSPEG